MMGIEGIQGFGANWGTKLGAISWGSFFVNVMLGLMVGGCLVAAYLFYKKWSLIVYSVFMRYDTGNGYRYYKDFVIRKKNKDESTYLWLIKTKLALPNIVKARVMYGKGKPLLDLYLDSENNIHFVDFTAKMPTYDTKGNVTGSTPLVTPTQTKEGKQAYLDWVKSTYSEHAKQQNPYLVPSLLLGSALIGMVMIILATKVA